MKVNKINLEELLFDLDERLRFIDGYLRICTCYIVIFGYSFFIGIINIRSSCWFFISKFEFFIFYIVSDIIIVVIGYGKC